MRGIHHLAPIGLVLISMVWHQHVGVMAFVVRPFPLLPTSHRFQLQNPRPSHFAMSSTDEEITDYDNEETLMKLHFSINDLVDKGTAFQRLSKYSQSFPFAAILPVQPLHYLPTDDGGVDIRFLRKKTTEKGSLDGGIRFFLSDDGHGIDLVAKRNSQGQTVSKIFSEKLVILAFIRRVTGEEQEKTIPPPTDVVTLSSIFHKWM
jgi:hypothetical protein